MHELVIAGGGCGGADYILPAAVRAAEEADCVIASGRFLEFIRCRKSMPFGNIAELTEKLPSMLENESIAVIVSGDPLMYSFCRTVRERYPDLPLRIIPGAGSLQMLGCAFGVTMENAEIISIHGRDYTPGAIAYAAAHNREVFFLCSSSAGPAEISSALVKYGLADCEVCVGENLGLENQKLERGRPDEFTDTVNPSLCTVLVINKSVRSYSPPALLPDSEFLRNGTPMTKEEVRAVILSRLRLSPDSTVWDIGAGTGSISVECARFCPYGEVYSVECRESALEILRKNKEYFSLDNITVIPGRAEDVTEGLSAPDAVFIGGTGGSLGKILKILSSFKRRIRIVMTAVTLETQSEAFESLSRFCGFDMIQMSVCGTRKIGGYTVLESNNPVMIYSCWTREE